MEQCDPELPKASNVPSRSLGPIESRLRNTPSACLVLSLVVRHEGEEHRPAIAARCLAIRTAEQPDEILMHGTVIRPEPIDQRRDVEPGRLAAHRVTAVDVQSFASGQGFGEGLLRHGDLH